MKQNIPVQTPQTDPPSSSHSLREQAEAALREKSAATPPPPPSLTPPDLHRALHELQVHQIELEMQNEQLQQARATTEELLAQYTDLYDFAPVGYLTFDRVGTIRQVNLTCTVLLGVERSQLLRMRMTQFVAEADRRAFGDFLAQIFAGEAKQACEVTLVRDGAAAIVVHIEGTRTDTQECRVVVIDITARKQAEEVIRKIDEQFRTLATIAPVGIYLADPAGSCLYANPEWCHVSGMQLAEALGNGWREGLHPADREQFAKNWNRMVASKGQWGMEYRFMTRDGTVTWVYGLAAAQYDTAGNVAQYVGINLDITARKATEAALLEKQALLKQAEKLGKIGGWEFDIDTGRQTWTEAVYAIHELDTYIPVHPTVEEGENYYTPESRPLIERAVQRAIGQGEAFDLELEIITAQGNPRSVHVIGGADQAHRKISGFIQDITERKQMENIHRFLGQTISGISGEAFFPALARFLAEILRMDFICIDRLEGDGLTARTEAVWCDGRFEDNVTYALKDTPCGDVVGKHVCCFPSKVCQFFPRDQVLQDLRAESYAGTTLFDHTGKPNGLIAVISRNPLASRELVVTTLQMVAVRAAGELERLQAEEAVRLNEAMLRESQRIAGMGSYVLDIPVGTWRSSEVLDEVFGIDAAYDCSVEGWAALIHPADRSMMLDHFRNDVLGRNQPFDKEYRIIRQHDHAERWVHGLGRLEYDTHENPVRMLGTIQDITERKQAAILLQRQAEELRASNNELEIFNRAVVGRELRMIELKAEINELCRRLREAPRYATDLSESNSSPGATTPHPPASA